MNDMMNENQLTIVQNCEFEKPLIHEVDSIFDNCTTGCHIIYFHTFEYKCVYDKELENIRYNDIFNLTIFDESMKLYEVN